MCVVWQRVPDCEAVTASKEADAHENEAGLFGPGARRLIAVDGPVLSAIAGGGPLCLLAVVIRKFRP